MDKLLVVYKKTIFDFYNSSPDENVRSYLELDDPNVVRIKESHKVHYENLEKIIRILDNNGVKYELATRSKNNDFSNYAMVATVGGDGTFIDSGHYIRDVPILGINSDPERSTGMSCSATADNFYQMIEDHNNEKAPLTILSRIEARIKTQDTELIVPELIMNEAMLYHKDRGNFRFVLGTGDDSMRVNSCYDLFVATPTGSTGSIYNFGSGIVPLDSPGFSYYITGNKDEIGRFHQSKSLGVESLIRQGRMQIDGDYVKYDFSLGDKISFKPGQPLTMIGSLQESRIRHGFV